MGYIVLRLNFPKSADTPRAFKNQKQEKAHGVVWWDACKVAIAITRKRVEKRFC